MMPKKKKPVARVKRGKTTAANLEARFDAGKDVSDYFDDTKATRINRVKQRKARLRAAAGRKANRLLKLNAEMGEWRGDAPSPKPSVRFKTYTAKRAVAQFERILADMGGGVRCGNHATRQGRGVPARPGQTGNAGNLGESSGHESHSRDRVRQNEIPSLVRGRSGV